MKTGRLLFPKLAFVVCVLCVISVIIAQPKTSKQQARRILDITNIRGGLIVHIGCGDGKLTAALYADDCCLVHGLDTKSYFRLTCRLKIYGRQHARL